MTLSDQIDYIRTEMRNFIVKALESGQMQLEDGKKLAKYTADHIIDTLDTPEKIKTTIEETAKEFTLQAGKIHSIYALLKVKEAREKVEQEVIPLAQAGKLDAALDILNKITI